MVAADGESSLAVVAVSHSPWEWLRNESHQHYSKGSFVVVVDTAAVVVVEKDRVGTVVVVAAVRYHRIPTWMEKVGVVRKMTAPMTEMDIPLHHVAAAAAAAAVGVHNGDDDDQESSCYYRMQRPSWLDSDDDIPPPAVPVVAADDMVVVVHWVYSLVSRSDCGSDWYTAAAAATAVDVENDTVPPRQIDSQSVVVAALVAAVVVAHWTMDDWE